MKSTSTTNSRAKSKAKEVGVDFRKGSTSDVIFVQISEIVPRKSSSGGRNDKRALKFSRQAQKKVNHESFSYLYTMCHLERVKILDYYVFFLLAKAGKQKVTLYQSNRTAPSLAGIRLENTKKICSYDVICIKNAHKVQPPF